MKTQECAILLAPSAVNRVNKTKEDFSPETQLWQTGLKHLRTMLEIRLVGGLSLSLNPQPQAKASSLNLKPQPYWWFKAENRELRFLQLHMTKYAKYIFPKVTTLLQSNDQNRGASLRLKCCMFIFRLRKMSPHLTQQQGLLSKENK